MTRAGDIEAAAALLADAVSVATEEELSRAAETFEHDARVFGIEGARASLSRALASQCRLRVLTLQNRKRW